MLGGHLLRDSVLSPSPTPRRTLGTRHVSAMHPEFFEAPLYMLEGPRGSHDGRRYPSKLASGSPCGTVLSFWRVITFCTLRRWMLFADRAQDDLDHVSALLLSALIISPASSRLSLVRLPARPRLRSPPPCLRSFRLLFSVFWLPWLWLFFHSRRRSQLVLGKTSLWMTPMAALPAGFKSCTSLPASGALGRTARLVRRKSTRLRRQTALGTM